MQGELETTAQCLATPRILLACEEAGVALDVQVKPDGHFEQAYSWPGPRFVDGDFVLFEGNAILRHIGRVAPDGLMPEDPQQRSQVDQWIDFVVIRIGMSMEYGKVDNGMRYLQVLDKAVAGDAYLCGDFSLADCAYATLLAVGDGLPRTRFPNLDAYLTRLASRPAWSRVRARLAQLTAPA